MQLERTQRFPYIPVASLCVSPLVRDQQVNSMLNYYTMDVTQAPFSWLLQGGGERWPLSVRLLFVLRKALGWHYPAAYARSAPTNWVAAEMAELPVGARLVFETVRDEVGALGYRHVGIARMSVIGRAAGYISISIAEERTTVCSHSGVRISMPPVSRTEFSTSFRSDLADGRILLTGRGRKPPPEFIRPHYLVEFVPDSTPTTELAKLHGDRVRQFSPEQIVSVPAEGLQDYLLAIAKREFDDMLASGRFRRLSTSEVARLKEIDFDFE